ncbi:MAG TPA: type II toxin-antitoxin system RelE/ParE family toxin [bacterium]
MRIVFSKNAVKFLEKLTEKEKGRVREKVNSLVTSIEREGFIPFRELNIRKLEGEWEGFLRMRLGKIRIVFKIERVTNELQVYEIDFRGNIYKQ